MKFHSVLSLLILAAGCEKQSQEQREVISDLHQSNENILEANEMLSNNIVTVKEMEIKIRKALEDRNALQFELGVLKRTLNSLGVQVDITESNITLSGSGSDALSFDVPTIAQVNDTNYHFVKRWIKK